MLAQGQVRSEDWSKQGKVANDALLVSCIFGEKFRVLHPAVTGYRSILFTNNPRLGREAARKGWEMRLLPAFPLTSDYHLSSLQSKYVKFLQFLRDHPDLDNYETITYLDHKVVVSPARVARILREFGAEKSVYMISSREGWSVRGEASYMVLQDRYRKSSTSTNEWIQAQVDAGRANWEGQIFSTTFMAYKNREAIMPLLDEVYRASLALEQPHCQVLWGVLCQRYASRIQSTHWTETDIVRAEPTTPFMRANRLVLKAVKACVKPVLNLLGVKYQKMTKADLLKEADNS